MFGAQDGKKEETHSYLLAASILHDREYEQAQKLPTLIKLNLQIIYFSMPLLLKLRYYYKAFNI